VNILPLLKSKDAVLELGTITCGLLNKLPVNSKLPFILVAPITDNSIAADDERVKLPVKVTSVELQSLPVKSQGFVGYDLETTTHNYFCGGVLVHNSSLTLSLDNEEDFHVCSRNLDLQFEENNAYWKAAVMYNVEQKMKDQGLKGYAIQGELIGEGINGNQYGIKGVDFYVFDVHSVNDSRYLTPKERYNVVEVLGLKHVPIISRNQVIQVETIQDLLRMVEGEKSKINGSNIEGWVFKTEDVCYDNRDVTSFKVISNTWLLKNE